MDLLQHGTDLFVERKEISHLLARSKCWKKLCFAG